MWRGLFKKIIAEKYVLKNQILRKKIAFLFLSDCVYLKSEKNFEKLVFFLCEEVLNTAQIVENMIDKYYYVFILKNYFSQNKRFSKQ